MLSFALSGGIASGKSTACRLLLKLCPAAVIFDSDLTVHSLQARREVADRIAEALGGEMLAADGSLDRAHRRDGHGDRYSSSSA